MIKKIFNVVAAKLLTAVFSFLFFYLISVSYQKSLVGEYVLFVSIATILIMVSNWGLNEYLFREVSVAPEEENHLVSIARRVKFIASLLLLLVFILIYFGAGNSLNLKLLIFVYFSMVMDAQSITYIMVHRARGDTKTEAYIFPLRSLIKLVIAAVFTVLDYSLVNLMMIVMLSNLIFSLYLRKTTKLISLNKGIKLISWISVLRKSTHYSINSVVAAMYIQLPPVIIVYLIGKVAVADYGVALQVLQVAVFVSVGISIVLQPVLARQFEKDKKIWKSNIRQYINIVILISLSGAIAMYYIAPYLVNIVFGDRYSEAANIVKYFSIVFFLQNVITGLIQPVLVSSNKINIYYAVYSICLMINITGCLVLLPKYSIIGSAYSLIISEFIAMILFVSYMRSMFRKIEAA